VQADRESSLEVSGEDQGQWRVALQAVEQQSCFGGFAFHEDSAIERDRHGESADVILADFVAKLLVVGALSVEKLRSHPDVEELADFLFGGEFVKSLGRPLLAITVEVDGTGLRILVFGFRGVFRSRERGGEERHENDGTQTETALHGENDSRGKALGARL